MSPEYSPALDEGSRTHLREIFTFEGGLPSREFDRELHLLLSDGVARWSDDPRGSLAAVDQIQTPDLSDFRRAYYDQGSAVLTVAGAADAQEVAETVEGRPTSLGPIPHFVAGELPVRQSPQPALRPLSQHRAYASILPNPNSSSARLRRRTSPGLRKRKGIQYLPMQWLPRAIRRSAHNRSRRH